mmetsp:Transcript_70272/g.192868  ORF Transcript_70272/g.192868 Transcript_70272/m.192868 type:complete len:401 (-) Transcript_70272:239-1441(-)
MGIKGLMPFINDAAPLAVKETKLEAMTGRTLAIDASMHLYQFLVAVRQAGEAGAANLSNEAGEVTSHIQGFLNRTIRMLELGIKPVYVFDGKPPELKSQTLAGRAEKKAEADVELAAAIEGGASSEDIVKAAHKTARMTPQMNEDVQELLRLLGCPVVLAPSEAEASCAALCKAGKAFAAVTEDMDVLTFGTPVMLKNLFDVESARTGGAKRPAYEVSLPRLLQQLDITMEAFVDFCIMCGCDYCGNIRGVGPPTAFKLLQAHGGSLEAAVAALDAAKRPAPESWRVDDARAIFRAPEVVDAAALPLQWRAADTAGLKAFLVGRHSFNESRVQKAIDRLSKLRAAGTQSRLDSFFAAKEPKAVPESAKFDPFKKKTPASKAAGKRPAGASSGGKGKQQRK